MAPGSLLSVGELKVRGRGEEEISGHPRSSFWLRSLFPMAMNFKSQVLPTDSLYGLSVTNMHFYSVPTSPSGRRRRRAGNASVGYLSSPITPQTNEDLVSNFETSKRFQFDGLEFETRPNFKYASGDHQQGGTTPPMAFADELFSNGQVMPLKIPP